MRIPWRLRSPLARLARHDDGYVRAAAAGHSSCPAEVLDSIIGASDDIRFAGGDSKYDVWVAVVENPNCPPEIHAQIESWNGEAQYEEMDEDAYFEEDAS